MTLYQICHSVPNLSLYTKSVTLYQIWNKTPHKQFLFLIFGPVSFIYIYIYIYIFLLSGRIYSYVSFTTHFIHLWGLRFSHWPSWRSGLQVCDAGSLREWLKTFRTLRNVTNRSPDDIDSCIYFLTSWFPSKFHTVSICLPSAIF